MLDMVQFAAQVLRMPPATFSRRPKPDYVCGECGSTDLDHADISVCDRKGCGKQSDFETILKWNADEGEFEVVRAKRCGHESHPDDVVKLPMTWYCRECGYVGRPRDLDQERWEGAHGL